MPSSDIPTPSSARLTEHEGMLLALVLRQQPVTAYQLVKVHEQSPVSSINASKGQVYPAIRRLKERGFIISEKVANDGRQSETLSTTQLGVQAVRDWVTSLDESHVVIDDPLRTRILSFDLLTQEERLEWVVRAKRLVKERRERVEAFGALLEEPYQQAALLNAIVTLGAKMKWLDELLYILTPD